MNKLMLTGLPLLLLLGLSTGFTSEHDEAMNNNLGIVKSIYKGFETRNIDTILNAMSEEVVWLHPGDADLIPFAGTFKGREGVVRFFEIAFAQIDVLEQKIQSYEGSGDKVLVLGYEHMRVKNTGKEYRSNWIHMYTLSNGKVIAFEEFIDTSALVTAFSPNER